MRSPNSLVPVVAGSREISAIGEPHSLQQDKLDLAESFAFFRRHACLILGVAATVVLIALAASLILP